MNRIVISKYHQCVQLAHLYEHMYIDALKVFLADKGFYPLLDYDLGGSAVAGQIVIEFEYWNEAIVPLIPCQFLNA